jgi:hypothetical protein
MLLLKSNHFIQLFLLLCFSTQIAISQIGIGFGYPEDESILTYEHFQRLESRILSFASIGGNGGSGLSESGLVCIPRVSIIKDEQIETGLSKTNLITLEFTFVVNHLLDGSTFATIVKNVSGTGSTRDKAINNALNKISTTDTTFLRFFTIARDKYTNMYVSKCESIIKQADVKKSGRQYEEALALLMSVPPEAQQCYDKAMKATQSIYIALSDQECKQHILNARTYISNQRYSDGLNELSFIDPLSTCYKEATTMAKEVESKITAEQNRAWTEKQQSRKDEVELKKMRIDAVKDIVVSYYKSKQANYNIIIK